METIVRPGQDEEVDVRQSGPWIVILYNDDYHSFDEVILQLQKATGCSLETAEAIADAAARIRSVDRGGQNRARTRLEPEDVLYRVRFGSWRRPVR